LLLAHRRWNADRFGQISDFVETIDQLAKPTELPAIEDKCDPIAIEGVVIFELGFGGHSCLDEAFGDDVSEIGVEGI
jgi:hypothetical protein